MNTIAVSQLNTTHGFIQRTVQALADLLDGIAEARTLANRYKTLSRMTDAQLARHGIKREDIPQAVLHGGTH